MTFETRLKLGFALAAVVLLLTSTVPFQTARMVRAIGQEIEESQQRKESLRMMLAQLQDAETGQRGFVITGDEEFLEPYHLGTLKLQKIWPPLASALRTDEAAAPLADRLGDLIELKLATLRNGVELRRNEGFEPARQAMALGVGKQRMDDIRALVDQLEARETARGESLLREGDRRAKLNANAGLMVTALDLVLLGYLLSLLGGLARARRKANEALRQTEHDLSKSIDALREGNARISLLADLGRALDAPASMDELYRIVEAHGARLLPGASWGLYAFRNSRDLLEFQASWGEFAHWHESFEPGECWALRRGQPHESRVGAGLVCDHYRPEIETEGFRFHCYPLIAHGEVLGLLAIRSAVAGEAQEAAQESMIVAVAEQLSLSISNMRLRETLRLQSIMDPLTGLFNRRYMEETLRRELARAIRRRTPLSIVMLDLDHFKQVNDEYGHDAGDAVLRAVAQEIKARVRTDDIACRYGGEEIALVLPDCSKEDAAERAQQILEIIRQMPVRTKAGVVRVTASMGVATFPKDTQDQDQLVRAADMALYRAKHSGRDRVVLAGEGDLPQACATGRGCADASLGARQSAR